MRNTYALTFAFLLAAAPGAFAQDPPSIPAPTDPVSIGRSDFSGKWYGTVDIGGANNSTSDLARQIREGMSAEDMADLASSGRSLEFTEGKLTLNGDTGISAGVKDDLVYI